MKIAFRVDASRIIGTGHVYRCLTLARRLGDEGAECHFVMRAFEGALFDLVEDAGFTAHRLPNVPLPAESEEPEEGHAHWLGMTEERDALETGIVLAEIGHCDWLVIDHYALDARWERRLRPHVDRILVIDDLADRPHDCDLLLDQNLQEQTDRYDGLLPADSKALIGPSYALLRREFAETRADGVRDYERPARNVLLFMGGVDLPGLTPLVLETIESLRTDDIQVHAVLGAGNPRLAEIEGEWSRRDWVKLYRAPTDLLGLMRVCDVAIGAGGTATWERCCFGLPMVIVSIATNQRQGATAMSAHGAALYAGDFETLDQVGLAAAITLLLRNHWLRAAIGTAASALVDGKGADRVARAMRLRQVRIRPAAEADAEIMFLWRNAERTRRFMRDPDPIRREDHFAWLAKTLASKHRDLLIGETDQGPIGVVRFDREGKRAEVAIYLVPGREGKGAGSDLLNAALLWLDRNRPETQVVEAEILEDNHASHHTFLTAGFQPFARTYRRVRP